MKHEYYNRENFPHFVINHGNWDIYRNDRDQCASIAVDDTQCGSTHFGDMNYVRVTLADILPKGA